MMSAVYRQGSAARKRNSAAVLVTGNTYPVKDAIKALGGRWDAAAKGWRVPAAKAAEAQALVARAGPSRPAKSSGYSRGYRPSSTRACVTGGDCSSFGDGHACGGYNCDGW